MLKKSSQLVELDLKNNDAKINRFKVRNFQPLDMQMHFSTPAVNLGFVPIQNELSNKSHRPSQNAESASA
jgi:hypothetical protein